MSRRGARSRPVAQGASAPPPPRATASPASPVLESRLRLLGWIAIGGAFLLVACLSLQQIASVDYWWQWKTGEVVSQHGPPRVDPFSFTNGGRPRVEVRWLYCWGLYQLTHALGHSAATIAKTFAVLVMFGIAAWLGGIRQRPVLVSMLVAMSAIACSQRLVVRPETLSYLFVILFVLGIERLQRGPSRWLWALLGLQVLWANVHGLLILGPAIAGAWGVGEWIDGRRGAGRDDPDRKRRLRTAAMLVGGTVVASCLNPYGPKVLAVALGQGAALGNEIQKTVFIELRSPFAFGQRFTAVIFYEVLAVLAIVTALLAAGRQRAFWLLLAGSQLYLSTTAIRNLPLFCLVAVPFIARNWDHARWLERMQRVRGAVWVRATAAVATIGFTLFQARQLVTDRFYLEQHGIKHFGIGVDAHYIPARGTDFLDRTGVRGPLWCTEGSGSYLISRGYQVFLDPRGDVYPDEFLSEYFTVATQPTPERVQALVRRWDLKVFFVETLVTALLEHMAQTPGWRLAYLDSEVAVFLRADVASEVPALRLDTGGPAWLARVRQDLPPPRPYAQLGFFERVASPAPYERLGRVLFLIRQNALARSFYEDALAASPEQFTAWALLGHLAATERDHAAAARYYSEAIAREPDEPELRWRAGLSALQANDPNAAAVHADAAVRLAPDDWQKLALKGMTELARGNASDAIPWLERAIQRASRPDPTLHRNLGKAKYRLGQVPAAIASLEQAWALAADAGVAGELAHIHAERGDAALARTWAERALQLDANEPAAREVLSKLP